MIMLSDYMANIFLTFSSKEIRAWEFPGGTVIRNRYFHCQVRLVPGGGTKIW